MTCNLCKDCLVDKKDCDHNCAAIAALYKICKEQDIENKKTLIAEYSKEIDYIEIELAPDLEELAQQLIKALPELRVIRDYEVRIGYLRSYEMKKDKGRLVSAECKKITGIYKAYLPFDFVITFYEPNTNYMTENQKKILMLHELKHIGLNAKGLTIIPHDIEEFTDILLRYGYDWNDLNKDVPDILDSNSVSDG